MDILWWEKTVEYLFIRKHVNQDMLTAPLDGKHERASDLIIAKNSGWMLIEFKRNAESIESETKKFTNFTEARDLLKENSDHHIFIYGENSKGKLELVFEKYFFAGKLNPKDALSAGINHEEFIEYLKKFVNLKKNSSDDTGAYGMVAGVSSDGAIITCMTISEFNEALELNLDLAQQPEHIQSQAPSGSKFGL